MSVATAAPAGLYFIHTDHLNTPRLITNEVKQTAWASDDPFGNNAPNENPSGLGTFTCNLRLPGQYFDKETNTHYNYFRDYDPAIGRYIQSDPIGLRGGINTYAYVGGNPLNFADPRGLAAAPRRPPRTPIVICPPAPSGYTFIGYDWGLVNRQRCFYTYDPETRRPKLECFGRGPGESGIFGWNCMAECKYRENCTNNVKVVPGKCFISPYDLLI